MVDADIDLMKKNPNAWGQVSQSLHDGHVLALLGSSTETHSGRPTFPFYLYDSSKSIDCLVAGVRVNNGCCCICCLFLIFRLIKCLLHFNTDYVLLLLLRGFIVIFFSLFWDCQCWNLFPWSVTWKKLNEWIEMNGYFYLLLIWAGDPFGTIKKVF